MKTHELKTWPEPFGALLTCDKTCEVRKNDRDFQVGDALHLREWDPATREYTGRELRREVTESARGGRQELAQNLATFQQTLVQQGAEATRTQNTQIDAFGQQLALLQKTLSDTLTNQLSSLSESNARRMNEVRETLEKQLAQLQTTNAAKLDEMRATVDEKLQTTLQARLGESFKQVAERLEQVHKGLGEMQTLAQGVGDLKHLLTNVKTRGIFGEAQLASLLEHVGDGFVRYRLGIGPKHPAQMELSDFVLGKFTPEQQTLVDQKIDHYLSGLTLLLEQGVDTTDPDTSRGKAEFFAYASSLADDTSDA